MRRGSILHYALGSRRARVVVLTADRYNPDDGLIAPLRDRPDAPALPAYLVPLNRKDWPKDAVIDLTSIRRIDPGAVFEPAGQLTKTTLGALSIAVRTYFGATE